MPVIDLGSVVGPAGPQGVAGATGAQGLQGNPGPNQVTNQTSTNLIGVLQGASSKVSVKPVDSAPTANSTNLVSSGGVKAELDDLSNRLKTFDLASGKSLQIRPESNSSRLQCLAASSGARTATAMLYFLSLYSTNSTYHIISPIVTGSSISVSTSGGIVTITNNHSSDAVTIMLQIFGTEGTINYTVI